MFGKGLNVKEVHLYVKVPYFNKGHVSINTVGITDTEPNRTGQFKWA